MRILDCIFCNVTPCSCKSKDINDSLIQSTNWVVKTAKPEWGKGTVINRFLNSSNDNSCCEDCDGDDDE